MKAVNLLLIILLVGMSSACSNHSGTEEKTTFVSDSGNVEVMYFHYSRRCATCNAVEDVSKQAISDYNTNNVTFNDYNLDEENGKQMAQKLNVSGQTLLIVSDDKRVNLTNEAFLNARTNPDKLSGLIVEEIDGLID